LEEVLAAEVGDDALFDLAVLAVVFDDADVLIDSAVGRADLDGAEIHAMSITTDERKSKGASELASMNNVTTFSGIGSPGRRRRYWKTRGF
jgi:hypothetical protein